MTPGSESGPRVVFICSDALLVERTRMAVDRETDWRLSVYASANDPAKARESYGLCILPVSSLPIDTGHSGAGSLGPLIAYGAATAIRSAFIHGARDYLREPWSPVELILRGEAVLNRDELELPSCTVLFDETAMRFGANALPLRHSEYVILRLFARSPDGLLTRETLRGVFGYPPPASRSIDVHVSRIRRKLMELTGGCPVIHAVRGVGYRIDRKSKIRA